jgi:hypothetical protein
MKSRTASKPAASSGSPQGSRPASSTATATDTLPPTPAPAPKPPSIYAQFILDLAAILSGKVTPDAELFHPVIRVKEDSCKRVGWITNQTTRELLSLSLRLKDQALKLGIPRTAGEARKHKSQMDELMGLGRQAEKLAWALIHDEFPASVDRDSCAVVYGWEVVRTEDIEDQFRDEARQIYSDDTQIEAHVTEKLAQHYAEEDEVDLGEKAGEHVGGSHGGLRRALLESLMGAATRDRGHSFRM